MPMESRVAQAAHLFSPTPLSEDQVTQCLTSHRHDICQKNYATAVLGTRILRKKRVNHDISQFATKEHTWFKMA